MKFVYQYRTKDNVSHKDVISAASKDAAFAALKARGIRPGRVEEAPGFFNKLFGKGKRWIAIAVLAIVAAVAVVAALTSEDEPTREPRSQIYGDPVLLQECLAREWRNVFRSEADSFLARYAQPGLAVVEPDKDFQVKIAAAICAGAGTEVVIDRSDSPEAKKVKRIVNWMKGELRQYLSDGGNAAGYVERLIERQGIECRILEAVKTELGYLERQGEKTTNRDALKKSWRDKNQLIREMGMLSIPMPEDWNDF